MADVEYLLATNSRRMLRGGVSAIKTERLKISFNEYQRVLCYENLLRLQLLDQDEYSYMIAKMWFNTPYEVSSVYPQCGVVPRLEERGLLISNLLPYH